MIRFGVIGAGRIGKVHAATVAANPKAKLVYVADAMPAAADALASTHGAKAASVEDILTSKEVDAVIIGSPTGFHAEQIQIASDNGKAIMCEKPVSLSVDAIHATLKVVEKNRSALMIGFNRRFDPNIAELEKRVRNGDVGEIEIVTVISRDPGPPPADYIKKLGRPVPRHDDPRL
jgi:myo-inositol 2-dehydrogenase / D-chiro-inositol 1-dehydrogenase